MVIINMDEQIMRMNHYTNCIAKIALIASCILSANHSAVMAQSTTEIALTNSVRQSDPVSKVPEATEPEPENEDDYYKLISLPIPEGIVLEVGGMATLPSGDLAICTRRGEVWIVSNPYMSGDAKPTYKLFASGLHEPLGLAYQDGDIYVAQRRELTRLRDADGDGRADSYDNVYSWPLSGNYHEYSYGPLIMPNGNMRVTLNLAWVGHGASLAPWRGWMLEITPDGKMTPIASGMRSPAGFTTNTAGDVFYTENQGDWVGSGRITHVEKGDFVGNPVGLRWTNMSGSPLTLEPQDIPDTGEPMYEVAKRVPALKPPAVWLPHGIVGTSTSAMLEDTTQGKFGPFEDQLFVGDQGQSRVSRVDLEKVKGEYQGVVFPFRKGFSSGVLRQVWGSDGTMFVGMTNRGWGSTGEAPYGLQRLIWTGKMPFEMKTVRAMPDGFEIEFTLPVDRNLATDLASYRVMSFTYKYHSAYGSPVIHEAACPIQGVIISEDGLKARLVIDSLRLGYIHEITAEGVRSNDGRGLLHNVGYYTLNNKPDGEKLKITKAVATNDPAYRVVSGKTTSAPSKAEVTKDTSVAKMPKRITDKPASWGDPDYTISMGTMPGLKFSLEQIQVRAGGNVKVVFNNNDDMLHNFVVVMPGTATFVGEMATNLGLEGQQKSYIPQTDKVLFHTNLLQPNTTESIYFTAPEKPGEYQYVCTFPGHYLVMRGILKII